ncbi:DUF2127 domain-containing protein [Candidatus Roizmanbacteria bacterium]|nr:DUF2127 domain-containing protein [Candidatus Roizmanbacteria bacterium]
MVRFYNQYRFKELLEDPHDLLINITDKIVAPLILHHRIYLMIFLIVLGLTKIIAAIGLLYEKKWALDLVIGLFIILLPFDIFTLFSHITFLKLLYFLINLLIVFYLMEFKPQKHLQRLKKYVTKIKK